MKMTVFWDAVSCSLQKFTNISEALSASIIRARRHISEDSHLQFTGYLMMMHQLVNME
jgi:hypothetical protein